MMGNRHRFVSIEIARCVRGEWLSVLALEIRAFSVKIDWIWLINASGDKLFVRFDSLMDFASTKLR